MDRRDLPAIDAESAATETGAVLVDVRERDE